MGLNNKHWHKEQVSGNFPRIMSGRNGYNCVCFCHHSTSGDFWKIVRNKTPVKMPIGFPRHSKHAWAEQQLLNVCGSRTFIRSELHIHFINDSIWAQFVAQPNTVISVVVCSDFIWSGGVCFLRADGSCLGHATEFQNMAQRQPGFLEVGSWCRVMSKC